MNGITAINESYFYPSKQCGEWCISQKITSLNNINMGLLAFPAISLVMILVAEYFIEKQKYSIASTLLTLSKTGIYILLFAYFYMLKFGVGFN